MKAKLLALGAVLAIATIALVPTATQATTIKNNLVDTCQVKCNYPG